MAVAASRRGIGRMSDDMDFKQVYMTVEQAAEEKGVHINAVYKAINTKRLWSVKMSPRKVLVKRAEVEAWEVKRGPRSKKEEE